jgi:HTH-type transcriptional regulator/antitoxin HipB
MDTSPRTPKQFGAELRRYRKKRGLTQASLGRLIDKRQATISTLESAGSGTLETLFAVLSALGIELALRPRSRTGLSRIGDIF